MAEYNTQLKKMILPEYGRNIHKMVDYCCTLADRNERNACAETIISTMETLFPKVKEEPDYKQKLWDHLAIMSDFTLDVDYPYEIVSKDRFMSTPEPVKYKLEPIKGRHYGKIIEQMVERAAEYPDGEEKDALVSLIAHHMKKQIFAISKEGVEDEKIFKDLYRYSHGKIDLDPTTYKLRVFKEAPTAQQPTTSKKKKKK